MSSRGRLMVTVGLALIAALLVAAAVRIGMDRWSQSTADVGALREASFALPADVPLPILRDAAEAWGLEGWAMTGTTSMRGGVAIADLDDDGDQDLLVSGGDLTVWRNRGVDDADGRFELVARDERGDATSVGVADLDGDGTVEVFVGYADRPPAVLAPASADAGSRTLTLDVVAELGSQPSYTTGIIPADLDGDGAPELVTLAYDGPDRVWTRSADGSWAAAVLPNSDGLSMAAVVFDADGDGSSDIWITRDVGWAEQPDAVYALSDRAWTDISSSIGGGQAIDGMGVTVADLDDDGRLDVYLSDLGDNEVLLGRPAAVDEVASVETQHRPTRRYEPADGLGIARIRPPGAADDVISSSWASGVTDLNHDGLLDLIVANGGFPVGWGVENKIPNTRIEVLDPPAVLLNTGEGRWIEVWPMIAAGLRPGASARGMALGDLDGDRSTDIVIANHTGGLTVLRNDTPGPVSLVTGGRCLAVAIDVGASSVAREGGADARSPAIGPRGVALLGAPAFLGQHAASLSVGHAEPVEVEVGPSVGTVHGVAGVGAVVVQPDSRVGVDTC